MAGSLVRRLHELQRGVAPGSHLFHVSGVVVDVVEAETAQKRLSLPNDENIVSTCEERNPVASMWFGRVSEKLRRHLQRRRRRWHFGANEGTRDCDWLPNRLRGKGRCSQKDVAVRSGIVELADLFEQVYPKFWLSDLQRLELGVRRQHSGKSGPVIPAAQKVVPGDC
jgi:hypothetical protein